MLRSSTPLLNSVAQSGVSSTPSYFLDLTWPAPRPLIAGDRPIRHSFSHEWGMSTEVRMLTRSDIDAVVEFSIRAWAQVFESFELALGDVILSGPSRTGGPCRPPHPYPGQEFTTAPRLLSSPMTQPSSKSRPSQSAEQNRRLRSLLCSGRRTCGWYTLISETVDGGRTQNDRGDDAQILRMG